MKTFLHSKPAIIIASSLLLILIIFVYVKSSTSYPAAIMGVPNSPDRTVVMVDIKKKVIIETGIKFHIDNNVESAVSYNKKYLAYVELSNDGMSTNLFIENLVNSTVKQITQSGSSTSSVSNITWIDNKTLLYSKNAILYILDVNSFKTRTVNIPDSLICLRAAYYPQNNGFIICAPGSSYPVPENDLYLIDSKWKSKKLLRKFNNYYIAGLKLMPNTDNLLIWAINDPFTSAEIESDILIYNIKTDNLKLLLKDQKGSIEGGTIFPYDRNNFLFQYNNILYNVNINTGKKEEFRFKNQEPEDIFYSIT